MSAKGYRTPLLSSPHLLLSISYSPLVVLRSSEPINQVQIVKAVESPVASLGFGATR